LIVAFFVFRAAKRLELYYRRIYLLPILNTIFRKGRGIRIVPNKIPRTVAGEFNDISICIEGFFLNKTTPFYKRELCYFIRSAGVNYLFKKRFFGLGKAVKITLPDEVYIERCFRFTRIFTEEGLHISLRNIHLVLRREHNKNADALIAEANLIDYNVILEERKRKKAEERAQKIQDMKKQAADTVDANIKKLRGALGRIFKGKELDNTVNA
jgi:hypothetical protein